MKINWKWPAKPGGQYLPWYMMARGLAMAPIIYLGIALTVFGILMAQGPEMARRWLKSAT